MTKNRGGRPRVDPADRSVSVCVTVPARRYDRLCREAHRDNVSIAEAFRRHLPVEDDDRDDDD
jgi:hypothetical protein